MKAFESAEQADTPGSATERSLRLLSTLAQNGRALALTELVEALGLPKGTVHRLCAQLMAAGFVSRDVNERDFTVGPALRRLALDTLNHGTVRGLRHQVLSDLMTEVGETCNFTAPDGAGVIYLDRVEAPWPWRLTLEVGAHVPIHCTASGKLFLALMPADRREKLLAKLTLQRMTPNTLTDVAALRRECEAIAADGHSFDREEFVDGLVAVAVPVCDEQGAVRAAVAVHAPTARMSLALARQHVPQLQAAAARMSALL